MRKESQVLISDLPLRNDQFALILMDKQASYRMFPVATVDQICESCMEFERYADDLSAEEQKTAAYFLKESCLTRGITPSRFVDEMGTQECDTNVALNEHVRELPKQAESHIYALGGQYVIDTQEHCKMASDYFAENYRDFAEDDRRTFAQNVSTRARELGTDCCPVLEKFASSEYDRHGLISQMRLREEYAVSEMDKIAYDKLSKHIDDLSVDEYIDLLGKLDKRANLVQAYGRHIQDPTTCVLGFNKMAESPLWTVEANGQTFTSIDLKKALKNPEVSKLYGEGLVKQLVSNPEVFTSLPKPDQESILSYAN